MLAIRLDPDTEERLAKLALRTGRTKTYYVREAILAQLQMLEATYLTSAQQPSQISSDFSAKKEVWSSPLDASEPQRVVRRRLHAADGRSSHWLERSPIERLAALEATRMAEPGSFHDQQTFSRFSRITRKAQS